MAEIKLNDSFLTEVAAFRAAGGGISTSSAASASAGGLSLPTVDAYQQRLTKIADVMLQFQELVKKDAADMEALAAKLKAADNSGG